MSGSFQSNRIWMSNGGTDVPEQAIAILQKKTKDVDEQIPVATQAFQYLPLVNELT